MISLIIIFSVVILIIGTYFLAPGLLMNTMYLYGKNKAHVKEKNIVVNGHRWSYLEGGKGETLIFIHGFPDSKYSWLKYLRHFTDRYHVIAPDLPGFGKTQINEAKSYELEDLTNLLYEYISKMKLDSFHLIGISMGGAIILQYTTLFPEKVKTVTAFDAFGFSSEKETRFQKYCNSGYIPFIYKSTKDFDLTMELVFNKPVSIPGPVKKYFIKKLGKKAELYEKMFNHVTQDRGWNLLDPVIDKISCPVLIIWGEKDQVFDVSTVDTIKQKLPGAETLIVKDAGHLPLYWNTEDIFLAIDTQINTSQYS